MKKFLLSLILFVSSVIFIAYQRVKGNDNQHFLTISKPESSPTGKENNKSSFSTIFKDDKSEFRRHKSNEWFLPIFRDDDEFEEEDEDDEFEHENDFDDMYVKRKNKNHAFSTKPQNTTPQTYSSNQKPSTPIESSPSLPISSSPSTNAPSSIPAQNQKGRYRKYRDGVYTGSEVDAYYGIVQVQVTIKEGRLTDISFLQYPNDRRTSQYINSKAMPLLRQEAIQVQSANVSGVTGASATSAAFRESLKSALDQAKN